MTPRLVASLMVAGLLTGCGGASSGEPVAADAPATVVTLPSMTASPQTSATPAAKPASVSKAPRPPAGYVEMSVLGVAATGDGQAVLLVDETKTAVLPIFIGGTEALSIDLRHRRKRYQRPLTHDLFDDMMRELGGKLVKVQVDDISGHTFVGTVFVRGAAGKLIEIDARPSDAIALAIGNRVPIYVARTVLDEAGIKKDELPPDAMQPPVPRI